MSCVGGDIWGKLGVCVENIDVNEVELHWIFFKNTLRLLSFFKLDIKKGEISYFNNYEWSANIAIPAPNLKFF